MSFSRFVPGLNHVTPAGPKFGFRSTAAAANEAMAALVYRPTGEFSGTDAVKITVGDVSNAGHAMEATASVTITVKPVNDAPTIQAPNAVSVREDTVHFFRDVSVSDRDDDTLTVSLEVHSELATISLRERSGLRVDWHRLRLLRLGAAQRH